MAVKIVRCRRDQRAEHEAVAALVAPVGLVAAEAVAHVAEHGVEAGPAMAAGPGRVPAGGDADRTSPRRRGMVGMQGQQHILADQVAAGRCRGGEGRGATRTRSRRRDRRPRPQGRPAPARSLAVRPRRGGWGRWRRDGRARRGGERAPASARTSSAAARGHPRSRDAPGRDVEIEVAVGCRGGALTPIVFLHSRVSRS